MMNQIMTRFIPLYIFCFIRNGRDQVRDVAKYMISLGYRKVVSTIISPGYELYDQTFEGVFDLSKH